MDIDQAYGQRRDIGKLCAEMLVFALPALALTSAGGMTLVQALTLLVWFGLAVARRVLVEVYVTHAHVIGVILFAFAGYFLVSLLRQIVTHDGIHTLDGPSRLLFSLSCIGMVVCLRPDIRSLWFGLCAGAIGAAIVALLEANLLDVQRVQGFTHHAISFGNMSVALGVMALCGHPALRHTRWAKLPVLAALCALAATLLSGSRGAWLGVLLAALPLLGIGGAVLGRRLAYVGVLVMALTGAVYFDSVSSVAQRGTQAVLELNQYASDGDASTSVGIRLELWKASAMMIADHPWVGVGRDGFHAALQELAAQGRLKQSPALLFSSSHNDFLNVLATGGLLDFSLFILLYLGPLAFFLAVLKTENRHRAAARAGIALVAAYIGFSLTDVMFWLMMPKVLYAMMVCVLIGFCLTGTDARIGRADTEGA